VNPKPIFPRAVALSDIEQAIDYYAREAGIDVAVRFVDTIEDAYLAISRRPATGSPRLSHELNLPGLRSRTLKRFPYLIFYVGHAAHIEVWRVLHAQRDMAAWLVTDDAG
jgi:toxin ParE1/3/4